LKPVSGRRTLLIDRSVMGSGVASFHETLKPDAFERSVR